MQSIIKPYVTSEEWDFLFLSRKRFHLVLIRFDVAWDVSSSGRSGGGCNKRYVAYNLVRALFARGVRPHKLPWLFCFRLFLKRFHCLFSWKLTFVSYSSDIFICSCSLIRMKMVRFSCCFYFFFMMHVFYGKAINVKKACFYGPFATTLIHYNS